MQIDKILNKDIVNKYTKLAIEKRKFLSILLVIIVLSAGYTVYGKYKQANPDTLYAIVSPASAKLTKSISVNGEIKSGSEIDVSTEISGKLVEVYVETGDNVMTGQAIAKIENSMQRAQLTQSLGALKAAEAQLASAQAQLNKILNGSTQEDKSIVSSQVSAAESSLKSAQDTARNVLQAAYAGTVSEVLFGTDVAIDDPDTSTPRLKFNTTQNSARLAVENNRVMIGDIIKRHKIQSAYDISDADLDAELSKTKEELLLIQALADDLLRALSGAVTSATISASTISSYTTTVTAARAQVLSNITAITSARYAIASAEAALQTAESNETKVFSSARVEDVEVAKAGVQAAEAAVLSAKGNYLATKSTLDKTYIKSPQSGIVVDIYKEPGEFTQNSTPIAKITSTDMYVSAMVSEVDIAKVSTGMEALVYIDALPEEVFKGNINFIYPDKVERLGIIYYEVRIDATELQKSGLTILPGMSLDVSIPYETKEVASAILRDAVNKDEDKYFVYILNPDKSKPIDEKFSKLYFEPGFIGDKYIEIKSGIADDEEVVLFGELTK